MEAKYNLQRLAADLRQARKSKNMSQAALAKQVGTDQAHVSRIEAGNWDVRANSLIEIARTLGLELMFIPKEFIPAVKAITKSDNQSISESAYIPQKEDEDEQ